MLNKGIVIGDVAVLGLALLAGISCGGGGAKPQTPAQVAEESQSNPVYNYKLGVLHLNQGNIPSAVLALQRCVAHDQDNYAAWNALGLAHFMGKQYKEAMASFAKALEFNPSYTDVHNNLGNLYSEMGLYDKAKAEYEKVLEDLTYPKPEAAFFNLAIISFAQDDLDGALKSARLALNMNPRFARVYNLIGQVYEKRENRREAISNYRVGLQIDPNQLELNFNLGVALVKERKFEEARRLFEKVVDQNPASFQGKEAIEYLEQLKSRSAS